MALAAIGAAALIGAGTGIVSGYPIAKGLQINDAHKNRIISGPDRYAEQFSEPDAKVELANWEAELKASNGNTSAIQNIQQFVDALKKRIKAVAAKPAEDHPTQEAPLQEPNYQPRSTAATILTGIGDSIAYPLERATDKVEHIIGADIPLPAAAFHRDITEGPNPVAAFWDLVRHTEWTHPLSVIEALWNFTVETFDYVIWDFKEFVRLIGAWNGSVWMLTGHPQYLADVVWRSVVTALIVAGAVMSGPLLLVVTEWTKMVVEVLLTMGHWVADSITYTVRRLR